MITNARIAGVGVNPLDYHQPKAPRGAKAFVMSSSALRLFWQCPGKWRRPIQHLDGSVSFYELKESPALADGNLFDTLLLTPELFMQRYVVHPPTYETSGMVCPQCKSVTDSKTCRRCGCERVPSLLQKPWDWKAEACKAFGKLHEAREIISPAEHFEILQAIKAFESREAFRILLDESLKQVHVVAEWHDEDTGIIVPIQCLIDLAPEPGSIYAKSLADVKRTCNARVAAWESWAQKAGYEIQAAWNVDLFAAAQPQREICSFLFLLSESHAPWETGFRRMDQDLFEPDRDASSLASGRRQYRRMMAAYCKCLASGKWPGYDDNDTAINGATPVLPNPYREHERQFGPQYAWQDEPVEAPVESDGELVP